MIGTNLLAEFIGEDSKDKNKNYSPQIYKWKPIVSVFEYIIRLLYAICGRTYCKNEFKGKKLGSGSINC
ncbi:hypothetical protein [Mucilaginibacter sp.]